MTDTNFVVSGRAINSVVQGLLKLPKRKFYNAVNFNDNQYRHEIANHYRDFKLRRSEKQANLLYYCGKVEGRKNFCLDHQQELPMAVHKFPNFEKISTPRRHQKCCEQRRPVLVYNDTIKRIQNSSDNNELLKKLAKKQVERLKYQKHCKKCLNNIETTNFQIANKFHICKFQPSRRRNFGQLETIGYLKRQQQEFPSKSDGGVIKHFRRNRDDTCGESVSDEALKYYFQLSTNFYKQSFLKNIKYLENLGERNQIRRKRHIKPQQQQQKLQCQAFCDFSNTIINSLETEHITDATLDSCDKKQNQISQNNPIVWDKNKLEVNEFSPNNSKNNNCAIRINIKPQTFNVNKQQANFFIKEIYGKKKTKRESKDFNSMNDYLNGNLQYTQSIQQEQQQPTPQAKLFYHNNTNINNLNCPDKLLDNLIVNLKELDIQENRTNLPRITLTDYTQKYPNDLETTIQTPAVTEENKKHLNSYAIKQSSIDCSQLDIPLETHYQSEARPP